VIQQSQVFKIAEQLGPVYGPVIVFAAATGLRPSERAGQPVQQSRSSSTPGRKSSRRFYRVSENRKTHLWRNLHGYSGLRRRSLRKEEAGFW
jgi:hypothetical protein